MSHVNPFDTDHDRHPDAGTGVTLDFCESCEQVAEETVTVYECSTCGATSEERRCENCHRFMARRDEPGCPDCLEPVVEKALVVDLDGAFIDPENYLPQGPAYAVRQAEQAVVEKTERQRKTAEKAQAQEAASRETTWGEVRVGDRIAGGVDRWGGVRSPAVAHVMTAADGAILVATDEYGLHVERHTADEPVRVSTDAATLAEPIEPVGRYVLLDEAPQGASSPVEGVRIQVGPSTRETQTVPVLSMLADAGNMVIPIGLWYDPALAVEGLDVLEATAIRLAEALGVTLDPAAGSEHVKVEEPTWVSTSGRLPRHAEIRVGADSWHARHKALADIRVDNYSAALSNPHALAYAVQAARGLLDRLTGVPEIAG